MQEAWVQSLGQERSPGGGHGYPLQYSCLEHSMDRGAWQVTVHAVAKSWTQLNDLTLSLSLTSMFKQPAQPYQCVSAVYWAHLQEHYPVVLIASFLTHPCPLHPEWAKRAPKQYGVVKSCPERVARHLVLIWALLPTTCVTQGVLISSLIKWDGPAPLIEKE